MNINQEREAFKEFTGLDSNTHNYEFGFWMKAKEHAKTPVTIYSFDTSNAWTHDGTQYSFATKEEATQDAIGKGYRVIDQ